MEKNAKKERKRESSLFFLGVRQGDFILHDFSSFFVCNGCIETKGEKTSEASLRQVFFGFNRFSPSQPAENRGGFHLISLLKLSGNLLFFFFF